MKDLSSNAKGRAPLKSDIFCPHPTSAIRRPAEEWDLVETRLLFHLIGPQSVFSTDSEDVSAWLRFLQG
jgi:hypothetical protein